MKKSTRHLLGWLTLFSVAMGYLEATVVVYLRQIYYPQGFQFPLAPMAASLAAVEFWREAATMAMLLGLSVLVGRTRFEKLASFLYSFAIWDLCYYLFLKVTLNWPESLFTWDILFLIPLPWVGPVWAPCLLSLTMIALAWVLLHRDTRRRDARLTRTDMILLGLGSLVVILSFLDDYTQYVWGQQADFWTVLSGKALFTEATAYVPKQFNVVLFWIGEIILVWGVFRVARPNHPFSTSQTKPLPATATQATASDSFADYLNPLS